MDIGFPNCRKGHVFQGDLCYSRPYICLIHQMRFIITFIENKISTGQPPESGYVTSVVVAIGPALSPIRHLKRD